MSPRSRSQKLADDLLHDIAEETEIPAPAARDRVPAATVETSLFLAPRTWQRPAVSRSGPGVSLSLGPIRVRLRRS